MAAVGVALPGVGVMGAALRTCYIAGVFGATAAATNAAMSGGDTNTVLEAFGVGGTVSMMTAGTLRGGQLSRDVAPGLGHIMGELVSTGEVSSGTVTEAFVMTAATAHGSELANLARLGAGGTAVVESSFAAVGEVIVTQSMSRGDSASDPAGNVPEGIQPGAVTHVRYRNDWTQY